MLLKLYKRDQNHILYWEAWEDNGQVTLHFGAVGSPGDTTTLELTEFEPPVAAIEKEATEARQSGFSEVDHEDLYELIVQYSTANAPRSDLHELSSQAEELLNDCLGWTGNGHCEMSEVTDTILNIYCFVVDPRLATEPILSALTQENLASGVVIAYHDKDENFVVLWPSDYAGTFHYY